MKAIGFKVVDVVNPVTAEVLRKVRVKFDNSEVINFLTDLSIDAIKADKDNILKNIEVRTGEFGKYCIVSKSTFVEEF